MKWFWTFLLGAAHGVLVGGAITLLVGRNDPVVWWHILAAYLIAGGAIASLAEFDREGAGASRRTEVFVFVALVLLWPVVVPLCKHTFGKDSK